MNSKIYALLLAATLAYLTHLGGLPVAFIICGYLLWRPDVESSLNITTEFLVVFGVGVALAAIRAIAL